MAKGSLQEYENEFACLVGAHAARATSLGRQALVVLLKAMGVRPGDKIGVCAFTCLSVVEAVLTAGAEPYYLDVDESLCIDPTSISKLKKDFLRVILLQHTFGNPGKLDCLLESSKRINALVIEDCAHAMGCFWRGKQLGQFGIGAIYSFQWGKPCTIGQGGMLTVNSESLLKKVDEIICTYALEQSLFHALSYAIKRDCFRVLNGMRLEVKMRAIYRRLRNRAASLNPEQFVLRKGYIRRPHPITVEAARKEISKWPDNMKMRRRNTEIIKQLLEQNDFPLWPQEADADITYLRYPIRTSSKKELLRAAAALSLDLAGWYSSPVHPLSGDVLKRVGYNPGTAPCSERSIETVVHLPTGESLSESTLKLIVKLLHTAA